MGKSATRHCLSFWTSCIGVSWELLRRAESQDPAQTYGIRTHVFTRYLMWLYARCPLRSFYQGSPLLPSALSLASGWGSHSPAEGVVGRGSPVPRFSLSLSPPFQTQTGESTDFWDPQLLPCLGWTLSIDRDRLPHPSLGCWEAGHCPEAPGHSCPDSPPTSTCLLAL